MGSFQQISLGIICLVAAFTFGTYVNNHPAGGQPAVSTNVSSLDGTSTGRLGNVQSRLPMDELATVDKRPAPIATMRNPLPPPSQLSIQRSEDANHPSLSMPTYQQDAEKSSSPGVQVPDFSMIAAEFKNTPIELPPLNALPSESKLGRLNLPEPPQVTLKNRMGQPATPRIETPSSPDQPVSDDRWNINAQPTLSTDDFAPKLKNRSSDPASRDPARQETHSALMVLDHDSTIPPDNGVASKSEHLTQPSMAADQTNDPYQPIEAMNPSDPSAPSDAGSNLRYRIPNGTLDTSAPFATPENAPAENGIADRQLSNRVRSKLPFGLNSQTKGELTRLRANADSKIALPTTRFVDHVVQSGESLQSISTRYFGKPDFYLDIYLANRNKLRNPADVPPGITVRVPLYQ